MRINNLVDFCAAHPAGPEWCSIERATYKYTDCGAWIRHAPRETGVTLTATVDLEIAQSIGSLRLRRWRRPGRAWQAANAAPAYVREFARTDSVTLAALRPDVVALHGAGALLRAGSMRDVYRCRIDHTEPRYRAGITVGSIVEGSGVEVGPVFLAYPFTMAQFWSALGDVDVEACAAWEEAHGGDFGQRRRMDAAWEEAHGGDFGHATPAAVDVMEVR